MEVTEKEYAGGQNRLHKEWFFSLQEVDLVLRRYGTQCQWNKLTLSRNLIKVYQITLIDETRREFFFGIPFRKYEKDQFSFVEYISLMIQKQDFPDEDKLIEDGLEPELAHVYKQYAAKILS